MIFDVLYVIFFFFTSKQLYSVSHFTGGSKIMGEVISIIAILNIVAEIAYLVYTAVALSFLHSLILLSVSIIFILILNRLLAKINIMQSKKNCDMHDPHFYSYYNYKCDVLSTMIAWIGIPINIIIMIFTLFKLII